MILKNNLNFLYKILLIIIIFLMFCIFSIGHSESKEWKLEKIQTYIIAYDDNDFGGISSINLDNKGEEFVMLSDKGVFFKGKILRDEKKKIKKIIFKEKEKLLKSNGEYVDKRNIDSEGMTKTKSNNFYISFESNHRIMFHEKLNSPGKLLSKHPDFYNFEVNKGIEALATNSKNDLYAIPEVPLKLKNKFPVYIYSQNKWTSENEIDIQENFQITDAIFLNDDQLIILERELDWVKGFRTQIRVINFLDDKIKNIKRVYISDYNSANNEGISIWNRNVEVERIKFLTISDNNFLPFIETVINEYELVQLD